MILKELTIKNFRSYYGDSNTFQFNPEGLTLIVGDNGDGKTTFVEALEWLFDTTNIKQRDEISHISEMAKSLLLVGEENEVRVTIKFDHEGDKELTRAIIFKKIDANRVQILSREFIGYESDGIERIQVPGERLLKRCFDAEIRKYSLFKGETQLDIFHQDNEALKRLIQNFSDIRRLDHMALVVGELNEKAEKAHNRELKADRKTAQEAKETEAKLAAVRRDMSETRSQMRIKEDDSRLYRSRLDTMVDNREAKEKLDAINQRIRNREEEVRKIGAQIQIRTDFNIKLLDQMWILCAFPQIFKEFQKKSSALSKEKRRLRDQFLKEKGKKEQLDALLLPDGVSALPWYMPDEGTMQEMINEEVCKVCGRKAEKGTEPYNFMVEKLRQFIEHQRAKSEELPEEVFPNSFIEELHNLSISNGGTRASEVERLGEDIKGNLEIIARLTVDLKKSQEALNDAKDEKSRLLIQLNGVSEDDLKRTASDVRDFMNKREAAEKRLAELKIILDSLKEKEAALVARMQDLQPSSKEAERFGRIHNIFDHIYKAFIGARETNHRRFITHLAERANYYLAKLNVTDFHGVIEIYKPQESDNVEVILKSENGSYVTNPSESQKTTMFMSVLFAIAEITAAKRETEYPLIFDAPTSSFGEMKESEFYEIINKIEKQCIIVTKDMLVYNPTTKKSDIKEEAMKLSCPIYRISKKEGFNPNDLSTIQVVTKKIKD